MARLTAKQRKAMPKSDFAVPEKAPSSGSYPIGDKKHARLALQMASKHPEDAARIRRKVHDRFPGIGSDMASKYGGDSDE